jgi:hypothetical protein
MFTKHELDAVWKFSYEAWFLLVKPLNILHLCMGRRYSKNEYKLDFVDGL